MTNQHLVSLSASIGVPVPVLDTRWKQARNQARSGRSKEEYWATVFQIFKNTVSLSADVEFPEWWTKRSDVWREKYLKKHPGSKFAQTVTKKRKELAKKLGKKESEIPLSAIKAEKPANKTADRGEKPANKPVDRGEKPANKHAEREEKPTEKETTQRVRAVKRRSALDLAKTAFYRRKKQVVKTLSKHTKGLKQLGRLAIGKKLTTEELSHATSAIKTAGSLLVGGLVGIALFTPLAGLVPELTENFTKFVQGGAALASEDEIPQVDLSKFDLSDPEQLITAMHEWLVGQDVEELVATLKARKEQQQLT